MDHKHLESFAQEARQQLLREVDGRVSVILNTDSGLLRERPQAVEQVRRRAADAKERRRLVEEVAYTWFNRFCALRLLDVRGYHNLGAVTPAEGATQPQLLQDAKGDLYPDGLRSDDRTRVQDLLSGRLSSHDPQGEAYRLLLRAVCNHLHDQMPSLFDKIDGPSELLLPEDLLSERSILERLRQALTPEACADIEVIGWLYQYYIAEKKDEIMARKGAVPSEDVPARTQLFTPHWIVRYLVENSLGRLWLLNHPESRLAERMDYCLAPDPDQAESDYPRVDAPTELRVCDPACGSGHMLTYAFDLLYAIYEEQGYDSVEIPRLILRHNLTGIEIDRRAGQLAALALSIKARERDPRYLRRLARCKSEAERAEIAPHIVVLEDVTLQPDEIAQYLQGIGRDLFTQPAERLLSQFERASSYGSLIRPQTLDFEALEASIQASQVPQDLFMRDTHDRVMRVLRMARALSPRYHVVVANPPYMSSGNMNAELKRFAKAQYPETKSDLFAMFIERNLDLAVPGGQLGFMSPFVWMFIKSYQALRETLIGSKTITSLIQLEYSGFADATVPICTFTVQNSHDSDYQGAYVRLVDFTGPSVQGPRALEAIQNPDCGWRYRASAADFRKIPGAPIAYWVSDRVRAVFEEGVPLGEMAEPRQGLATADNARFLRLWAEVSRRRTSLRCGTRSESLATGSRWFPYNKGGQFRKWYGNSEYVVDWEHDGERLIDFRPRSVIRSPHCYFKPSISWSKVSSGNLAMRFFPQGHIFDVAGCSIFTESETDRLFLLGLSNTLMLRRLLATTSPTLNFEVGQIANLPVLQNRSAVPLGQVESLISIARQDWDAYETSWDFTALPLTTATHAHSGDLASGYAACRADWRAMTEEMQRLEVQNNRLFIDAYGLQEELSPEVPLREITLTCNPHYRYPASYDQAKRETRLRRDTAAELLSYAVGCLFGRYALDKPGLILADQGSTAADFCRLVPAAAFPPVKENVIPLVGDDWFADDLCALVQRWLGSAFGEEKLSTNVAWLEEALGADLERYLTRTFCRDHCKTYKKRPIYWLFASPKGSFQALIYLHRYREDTVSLVLQKLRAFRGKLAGEALRLQAIERDAGASPREQTRATKALNKLALVQAELADYERETLLPLATQQIALDLDDGVVVNYAKLGQAVKAI